MYDGKHRLFLAATVTWARSAVLIGFWAAAICPPVLAGYHSAISDRTSLDARDALNEIRIWGPATVAQYGAGAYRCEAIFAAGTNDDITGTATWSLTGPVLADTILSGTVLSAGRLASNAWTTVRARYDYYGAIYTNDLRVLLEKPPIHYHSASSERTSLDARDALSEIRIWGPATVAQYGAGTYHCTAYFTTGTNADITGTATWSLTGPAPADTILSGAVLNAGRLVSNAWTTVRAVYDYNGAIFTNDLRVLLEKPPIHYHSASSERTSLDARDALSEIRIWGPTTVAQYGAGAYRCEAIFAAGTNDDITGTATWSLAGPAPVDTILSGAVLNAGRLASNAWTTIRARYDYYGAIYTNDLRVLLEKPPLHYHSALSGRSGLDSRDTVVALHVNGLAAVPEGRSEAYRCMAEFDAGPDEDVTERTAWSITGVAPAGTLMNGNSLFAGDARTNTAIRLRAVFNDWGRFSTGFSSVVILPEDAYEPNDARGAAWDLSANAGTWLSIVDGHGYQWDEDWYRIRAQAGERITAQCVFRNADGDIDVRLVDSYGAVLEASATSGDTETLSCVAPAADAYFVEVYGANRGNAYDLWWDRSAADGATGFVRVVLGPAEAEADGARWQVAGVAVWRESGAAVMLSTGRHAIACRELPGWVAPVVMNVEVRLGQTAEVVRTYARQPPAAAFAWAPAAGTAPLDVRFTDQSAGAITNRVWDFGDGQSRQTGPTGPTDHRYTNAGVYTVRLTVAGPGGSHTAAHAAAVTVRPPAPRAEFGAAPLSGVAPLRVTFTDHSTGAITNRLWDFGDGESRQTGPTGPTDHLYTNAGAYSVRLSVAGPGGADSALKSSYITVYAAPPSNRPPVLCVAAQQIFLGSLGDMARLDASCSSDPDGDALFFSWREHWGNPVHGLTPLGSEAMAVLPVYFPAPGRYAFEVRLSDGVDASAETRSITVYVPGVKGAMQLAWSSGTVRVPDARVAVYGSAADARTGVNPLDAAITDSRGRFTLENVSPLDAAIARTYWVREHRFGYLTNEVRTVRVWPDPTGKPEEVCAWSMGRGTLERLAGRVTDPAGRPIEGALAAIVTGVGGEAFACQTEADGTFSLSYVPHGAWTMQLRADGFRSEARDITVGPDMGEVRVRLTLASGATVGDLSGRVVRAGLGRPIEGAQVALGAGAGAETWTDAQGAFGFAGLPVGMYVLTVTKPGFEAERLPMIQVGPAAEAVTVYLNPAGRVMIQGTVLDRISGKPVRLATVGIESEAGLQIRSDVTDRTGFFQIEDAPVGGGQTLRVSAPGYQPETAPVAIAQSARLDDIRLRRASNWRRPASGNPAGRPVARLARALIYLDRLGDSAELDATGSIGADLRYVWRESPRNPVSLLPLGSEFMARIELRGFTKPGIYQYELQVRDAGGLSANAASATVFAPGLAGNAHASPSDGVVGLEQVTVRAYTNYADAASWSDAFVESKLTRAQPPGDFTMDGLSTGVYWIAACRPDGGGYRMYGPVLRRVNFSAAMREAAVNLSRGEFRVEGFITDTNKAPLDSVRVVVAPGLETESYRTATDASGRFELGGVPGGSGRMVLLMKDGYETRVHTLDLALDTSVNLTMRRVSGARLASLSGRITAQYHGIALPVPGAEVVLGSGLGRAVTDKDGRYELRGLAPGYYFGLVRREGYRSRYLDDAAVTELRSGVNERDRVLEFADRGPAIRGIVVGGGGEPVSGGIRVSVVETTPGSTSSRQPAMRVLEGGAVRVESESVTADAGGVVQLEDLPHGERRLRIELANGAVFTNAVYVNGAMETVIAVPDALAAYDEWKGRRFLEAGEWKTRIEQDPDADGFSNWEEFVADTDPTNGGSFPRIAGWTGVGGKSVWIDSCSSGRLYEAQWTTNLLDPCWRRAGLARLGTGSNLVIGVTNAVPGGRCFYRLGVRLP